MPAVSLSPFGGAGVQFFDNNGVPLSGGKIFTYLAGTTTPAATYTTQAGNVAHTNPIILDAAGRVSGGEIWVTSTSYKFILKTSTDVLLVTLDNIFNEAAMATVDTFAGTGAQVSYSLTEAPFNNDSVSIFINGVYQQKSTYTVTGINLVFSEAPPVNSSIEVNY